MTEERKRQTADVVLRAIAEAGEHPADVLEVLDETLRRLVIMRGAGPAWEDVREGAARARSAMAGALGHSRQRRRYEA